MTDLFRVLCKLSEIVEIADRATIWRRGKAAGTSLMAETNERQIVEWTVGQLPEPTWSSGAQLGAEGLRAEDLQRVRDRGGTAVRSVSFAIRQREILGFRGVDGNRQSNSRKRWRGFGQHMAEAS